MMHQINLKGELYPVKFGMWSLVLFEDMTGKSLINWDIEKELSFKDSLILVYCGLKNGARAEKKEFKLTLEDIADLLDGSDSFSKIMEMFAGSLENPNLTAPQTGQETD